MATLDPQTLNLQPLGLDLGPMPRLTLRRGGQIGVNAPVLRMMGFKPSKPWSHCTILYDDNQRVLAVRLATAMEIKGNGDTPAPGVVALRHTVPTNPHTREVEGKPQYYLSSRATLRRRKLVPAVTQIYRARLLEGHPATVFIELDAPLAATRPQASAADLPAPVHGEGPNVVPGEAGTPPTDGGAALAPDLPAPDEGD